MKTLYLLRHAHTVSAAPPLMGDHERFLSPQGVAEAEAVGAFMQARRLYPDFVLSSSSVRTIQTARLVFGVLFREAGLKVNSHFSREFYQAPAARLLAEIQSLDDSIGSALVVAHNPGVSDLAMTLGGEDRFERYDPATLTVLKMGGESWRGFAPDAVRVDYVFAPGDRDQGRE